jgi:hypothetical protein
MTFFKKHSWVCLVPLLAIIYWKKSKETPVIKLSPSSFIKDSILVHSHDQMKIFVVK